MEDTSGYPYTNTRVRVMKSKLLRKADYDRVLKMDESEIARFMQETNYKEEMNELAAEYSGVQLIEYALNKNLENSFKRVFDFSIQSSHKQIKQYFRKWDLWNVKMLLRGKMAAKSNEEIRHVLIPVGELKQEFLEGVVNEASTLEEAIEFFKGTEYHSILKEHYKDFGKMEDELDKYYYEKMLQESEEILKEIILEEIKIRNKLNLLRAKETELNDEEIQRFLINVNARELKKLKMEIEKIENTAKNRIQIEKGLIKKGLGLMHTFKKNVGPIMGYFIAKENEVRNLRVIARGKHSNLSEELIEEQLVVS